MTMVERTWPPSSSEPDAQRPAVTHHCFCGTLLPRQRPGGRRVTCSLACRRQRDRLLRHVRACEAGIALWLVNGASLGHSSNEIAIEIAALEEEIGALTRALQGAEDRDPDDRPSRDDDASRGHQRNTREPPEGSERDGAKPEESSETKG